jgi:hypothetical protein
MFICFHSPCERLCRGFVQLNLPTGQSIWSHAGLSTDAGKQFSVVALMDQTILSLEDTMDIANNDGIDIARFRVRSPGISVCFLCWLDWPKPFVFHVAGHQCCRHVGKCKSEWSYGELSQLPVAASVLHSVRPIHEWRHVFAQRWRACQRCRRLFAVRCASLLQC